MIQANLEKCYFIETGRYDNLKEKMAKLGIGEPKFTFPKGHKCRKCNEDRMIKCEDYINYLAAIKKYNL